jgi:hypothetical protein
MSNSRISGLPSATTPLAGTEVLPIIQSSVTDQVSVANLTAGRAVSALSLTLTNGNTTQGTTATGYNFTANTPASGMTSQLLSWYEEGTWTPTVVGATTAGSYTVTASGCNYVRVGRQVTVYGRLVITVNTAGSGTARFGGLPFPKASGQYAFAGGVWTVNVSYGTGVLSVMPGVYSSGSDSTFFLAGTKNNAAEYDVQVSDIATGSTLFVGFSYLV